MSWMTKLRNARTVTHTTRKNFCWLNSLTDRHYLFGEVLSFFTIMFLLIPLSGKEARPEPHISSVDDGTGNNISVVPSSGDMSGTASESISRFPSALSGENFMDSPPSYEYCMANCSISRTEALETTQPGEQIFSTNGESSRCACGGISVAVNANLTIDDELPPYSSCVGIRPPSYDAIVTQQLQTLPEEATDSHDPPHGLAQFSTVTD